MDFQKIIEQSLTLLFPLIIVFLFVYYMLKSFFDQFEKQRKQEIRMRFSEETLPLRLQAYERITLFLERIKPESMVIRLANSNMNTMDLQRTLLENIREEFEHNLSQQIYISSQAWSYVVAARQSITQLVGSSALHENPEAPYIEYANSMLEEFAATHNDPITVALKFIQEEAKEIL